MMRPDGAAAPTWLPEAPTMPLKKSLRGGGHEPLLRPLKWRHAGPEAPDAASHLATRHGLASADWL